MTDGFTLILLAAVLLRGLGAGMITGILLLTMPARSRLGLAVYAHAIRTMYEGWGVKVYAFTTFLGLILTIIALPWALAQGERAWVIGLLIASRAPRPPTAASTALTSERVRVLWCALPQPTEIHRHTRIQTSTSPVVLDHRH